MVWGGMRGALALALVLSIEKNFPYRSQLLTLTFGVVAFTIVVQGITMKPLIRILGISTNGDDDYSRARVRQVAISSAALELENMANQQFISRHVYAQLHQELHGRLENANMAIDSILDDNHGRLSEEFKDARARLRNAEIGAIEQAMHDGWVSAITASQMINQTESMPANQEPPRDDPGPSDGT